MRDFLCLVAMVTLIVARALFKENGWVASIAVFGLLVAWLDILGGVYNDNGHLKKSKQSRCIIIMGIMAIVAAIMVVFCMVNIVQKNEFLNSTIVMDEITLLSLLISLLRNRIVSIIDDLINIEKVKTRR